MLEVRAGNYRLRGVSLGGVYTTIQIPELGAVFDVGLPFRAFAGTDHLFLTHGHGDHVGSLPAMLGQRGLLQDKRAPRVYLPAPIVDTVQEALHAMSRLQRFDLAIDAVPMNAGDEVQMRKDLWVRGFRAHHPVPCLGYSFFDRVQKLRSEFVGMDGQEVRVRKERGDDLFETVERPLLSFVTDTLIRVLETSPSILKDPVLVLECTFLDDRKSLQDSRAGCHIHLDELLQVAESFENEKIVRMPFSQLYTPAEVHALLRQRLPECLQGRVVAFAPKSGPWPGC